MKTKYSFTLGKILREYTLIKSLSIDLHKRIDTPSTISGEELRRINIWYYLNFLKLDLTRFHSYDF